jgi:hypothetical protein
MLTLVNSALVTVKIVLAALPAREALITDVPGCNAKAIP